MTDPWKRDRVLDKLGNNISIVEESDNYPQQLELQLNKIQEATPEEVEEWLEKELLPLGEKQLPFIAMMAMIQFLCLVGMFSDFWLIDRGLHG